MGIFNNLFGKTNKPELSIGDKETLPVLPLFKRAEQQGVTGAYTIPFLAGNGIGIDINIAFTQSKEGLTYYLTEADLQNSAVHSQFNKWRENIDQYEFDLYSPQKLNLVNNINNHIVFAAGHQHSAEKVLSSAFLTQLCESLNTEQVIISIPRRTLLMATSFHEDFLILENFFFTHQDGWQKDDGNELLSEMVFVADRTRILYAASLDFRINLYEKDGQYKLSYSTTKEIFEEDGSIDFRAMLEKNKIQVKYPI